MKHRTSILILLSFFMILSQREVSAQSIPLMIPYSGTVAVNGTPLPNGNGLFKFAIVNDTGNVAWWTNDNTHLDGTEPEGFVTIPVNNGVFTVKLGDTSLGMVPIQTALFNNNSVAFLRVWFSDGVTGFQQLAPDRQFVSVPYAYKAESAEKANSIGAQIITVIVSGPNVGAGSFGTAVATCPTGFVAIGGGVDPANVLTMVVTSSAPVIRIGTSTFTRMFSAPEGQQVPPIGWHGAVVNNAASAQGFKVAAICSK